MDPAAIPPLQSHLLTMLASLTGAIAHELRTPLSVIQNELQYFETLIDPAECDRSKRSCTRLATAITHTTLPAPGSLRTIACRDLAGLVPDVVLPQKPLPQTGVVYCFPELLQWTLSKLLLFLREKGSATRLYLQAATDCLTLRTSLSLDLERQSCTSLTEYWKGKTGNTSCIPPLVELILHAQGMQVTACDAGTETVCICSIPLQYD